MIWKTVHGPDHTRLTARERARVVGRLSTFGHAHVSAKLLDAITLPMPPEQRGHQPQRLGHAGISSRPDAVVEVYNAAPETTFIE